MICPATPSSQRLEAAALHAFRSAGWSPDYVSASAIRDYLQCSLRFYFKRILELPEPNSVNLHLGKAVHAGLQRFWLVRWRGGDTAAESIVQHYREVFGVLEAEQPVSFKDGERDGILEKGEAILRAYCESEHAQIDGAPLGVEVKLQAEFPQLPVPLLGYVDLVRSGSVVCDFKTVAATPNLELEAFQHEMQLTAYQLLVEEATGEAVKGRELVFLVKTKTPKVIVHRMPPADTIAKARFWSMAQAMLGGVRNERWNPQPGMHCSWCSYRAQCSRWKGDSYVD